MSHDAVDCRRLFERMARQGETFWEAAYPMFMSRDMTRDDLRALVRRGIEASNSDYHLLVRLFNMPESDYMRFVYCLRNHRCHMTAAATVRRPRLLATA